MALPRKSRFDAFADLCREAAARGSTSSEQLARLAERSEPEIVAAVIANPATTIEVAESSVRKTAPAQFGDSQSSASEPS
jgi:hypothetical protein